MLLGFLDKLTNRKTIHDRVTEKKMYIGNIVVCQDNALNSSSYALSKTPFFKKLKWAH